MPRVPAAPAVLAVLLVVAMTGCGSSEPAPANTTPTAPEKVVESPTPEPVAPPKPDPAEAWSKLVAETKELLESGKLSEVEAALKKFDGVYAAPDAPGDEQTAALEELKSQFTARQEERLHAAREEKIALAKELVGQGKYEEATQALNDVTTAAPTNEQRDAAAVISGDIESRRKARSRLSSWMQMLASDDKKKVRTAQTQLHKESEAALPILLETVQNPQNPVLVANTLELLRRLQRPEQTLPAMLGVLKRESQEQNWDDAVREIGRSSAPGLGGELLTLATTLKNPKQRAAALAALAQVPDPPADTLVRLLPRIYEDSPDLPYALQAAAQAVRQHRQFDFIARRGIDMELSPEEDQLLSTLAERLQAVAALKSELESPNEAALAAGSLGMAIRLFSPKPFESVKVLSFGADSPDGKAAAVLDGVWDKTDYPTMWRHLIDRRSSILLDLGEEKTVEGIRIWNFNEPGGTHRGWKEVDVFVTSKETALTPVATGLVAPAPGAAGTPDYSVVIPVPSVRGRYVTLQAKSVWRPDTYMGLSEVQVLGW